MNYIRNNLTHRLPEITKELYLELLLEELESYVVAGGQKIEWVKDMKILGIRYTSGFTNITEFNIN